VKSTGDDYTPHSRHHARAGVRSTGRRHGLKLRVGRPGRNPSYFGPRRGTARAGSAPPGCPSGKRSCVRGQPRVKHNG
jgi:hypothetical protein